MERMNWAFRTAVKAPTSETVAIVAIFGVSFSVAALGAIQAIGWVKTGHWSEWTMASLVMQATRGTAFGSWLSHPESWDGLHTIVEGLMKLPIWAWLLGIVFAAIRALPNTPGPLRRSV